MESYRHRNRDQHRNGISKAERDHRYDQSESSKRYQSREESAKDRYEQADNDHLSSDDEYDRENSRQRELSNASRQSNGSSNASFQRPATYDPQLAQRELHSAYENGNASRKQILKCELGLSDDDVQSSDDEMRRTSTQDVRKLYEKVRCELEEAKEKELRLEDSLSKLQLLSKSQTAILRATLTKRLQEKDAVMEEQIGIIGEYESRLKKSGIEFVPYTAPEPSRAISNGSELDSEIKSMHADLEKLRMENHTLKVSLLHLQSESAEANKAVFSSEIGLYREKCGIAEAQIAKLTEELKLAHEKLKLEQYDRARVTPLPIPEQRLKEPNGSDGSSPAPPTENTITSHALRIKELESQLEHMQKEMDHRESLWQERNDKIKSLAESELGKIKQQAKKAILDLKQKLDTSAKNQQGMKRMLMLLVPFLKQQRLHLTELRAQAQSLQQQAPILAKSLSDSILQRVQSQAIAMAGVIDNYHREIQERKRLFNLVQELKGNIRVMCRIRPMSRSEQANGCRIACKFAGNQKDITLNGEKSKSKTWEFDRVFDLQSTQDQVFAEVESLVTSSIDGYNVCIFAYGQTGSGKTFTMAGTLDNPGINTRSLQLLFDKKTQRSKEYQDDILVSIMEIYNEQIRDLLVQNGAGANLQVRQGPDGIFVPGLTLVPVQTLEAVFEMMEIGNKNRSTHATDMNEYSSRSHSVLSIHLNSVNLVTQMVSNGRLILVDLAGSERLSKTGAEGQRLKEAQNINKSLSALGDVIAARANRQKHVPYRNSTLTYLLQDALGGDSKTLMVACASPVDYNCEESFCTLNFASRTRTVKLGKAIKHAVQMSVKGDN